MSSTVNSRILEPYAGALMNVAQNHDLVDRFSGDVRFLLELLQSSRELEEFLDHPFHDPAAKKAVLGQLVSQQVHPLMANFLMLLVDRRRINLLEGVCREFQAMVRRLKQTVLAEIVSAVSLTATQEQEVRDRILALTKAREVELQSILDPAILGGVIIKIGSQVVDASLRSQLRRLSIQMTAS